MGNLDQLRRDLDDEQLVVMEAIEPLENELASLADQGKAEEDEIEWARDELGRAEAEIDQEIAHLREKRKEMVATIPNALIADYERLRSRLGGVGVRARRRGDVRRLPPDDLGDRARPPPPRQRRRGHPLRTVRENPRLVNLAATGGEISEGFGDERPSA